MSSSKYFGVTLNGTLTAWSDHIAAITSKANSTLGILRRNLSPCTAAVKDRAYRALVRPQLEYASAAWSPYLVQDCYKLETIQRQAARFVLQRTAYYQHLSHDASTSVGHPIHQMSPHPTIDVPQVVTATRSATLSYNPGYRCTNMPSIQE